VLLRLAVLAGVWAGLVGLLVAAGEVVIHSSALIDFDHHATRVVVSSRTPALNSAMKVMTWLGSWVALLVTAVVIAALVIARRLPVLAAVVAVFAWAGEAGGVAERPRPGGQPSPNAGTRRKRAVMLAGQLSLNAGTRRKRAVMLAGQSSL